MKKLKLFFCSLLLYLLVLFFVIIYRLIRQELKLRNKPWVFLILLPIWALIVIGFLYTDEHNRVIVDWEYFINFSYANQFFLAVFLFTIVFFAYDNMKGLQINKLTFFWRKGNKGRVLELLPTYWLSLFWLFISFMVVIFSSSTLSNFLFCSNNFLFF